MALLRWHKLPEYSEEDETLVRLHLQGRYPAACVKYKVIGDIYQKYDGETGEKLPKEATLVFESDRQCRLNWAALRRALIRLSRSGYVTSFHLYYDGQLYVKWFSPQPENIQVAPGKTFIVKHTEMPKQSCIKTLNEDDQDIRHKSLTPLPIKKDTGCASQLPDIVSNKAVVQAMQFESEKQLHSEEARIERQRAFMSESSACDRWAERFKFNPDYFSGAVVKRSADQQQMERGYCVWPSLTYKIMR